MPNRRDKPRHKRPKVYTRNKSIEKSLTTRKSLPPILLKGLIFLRVSFVPHIQQIMNRTRIPLVAAHLLSGCGGGSIDMILVLADMYPGVE